MPRLIQKVEVAVDYVFACGNLNGAKHRFHFLVWVDDSGLFGSIKECQSKVVSVIFKKDRSRLWPFGFLYLLQGRHFGIVNPKYATRLKHIVAILLRGRLLRPHLELSPRLRNVGATRLNGVGILVCVLQQLHSRLEEIRIIVGQLVVHFFQLSDHFLVNRIVFRTLGKFQVAFDKSL